MTAVYVLYLLQIEVCEAIYRQSKTSSSHVCDGENSPQVVGHNVYILAYQLSQYKRELKAVLDKATQKDGAIRYYSEKTAQIEVSELFMHAVHVF